MSKSLFLTLVILAIGLQAEALTTYNIFQPVVALKPMTALDAVSATIAVPIKKVPKLLPEYLKPMVNIFCSAEVISSITAAAYIEDSKYFISLELATGSISYDEASQLSIRFVNANGFSEIQAACQYEGNTFNKAICEIESTVASTDVVKLSLSYKADDGTSCLTGWTNGITVDLSAAEDETPEETPVDTPDTGGNGSGSWDKIDTSTTQPVVPVIPTANKSSGDCSLNPNAVVDGFEWLVSLAIIGLPFVPITFKRRKG